MLAGPKLEICLTQDPECWAYRTPHIFQEGGGNRILAAEVLPPLFSQEGAQYMLTQLTYLSCFQRTTQFGYLYVCVCVSMLFNFEAAKELLVIAISSEGCN